MQDEMEDEPSFSNERKILVVDDQLFNIEAIKNIISIMRLPSNVQVVKAFNGRQAFDIIKSDVIGHENEYCSFKLVLMDC